MCFPLLLKELRSDAVKDEKTRKTKKKGDYDIPDSYKLY